MDFVEIWNVCTGKVIIKAAKGIFNSDKICRSYCDFYFGVTFLECTVYKNYKNRLRLGEVIVKNKMSRFMVHCEYSTCTEQDNKT